ncbi:sulfatase [Paenibacillus algicola]|uniref:Sulfatase n=1 Tax=Paenibacillus algicola TaxID=2565926 RepID=A0A4P8XGU5_9BACL|nr:sulfatase [Paenibacillus algicola]QCT01488.1 sulfatase [Paenibacillus algicola]
MNPKPLNILWISLEDTSPRFGCYGDAVARTPHIDQLSREGCRYPNTFATAGVCAPSRCSVITGMYSNYIGGQHMRTTHTNQNTPELPTPYEIVPPSYVKVFSEYLRAQGYYCTNNLKTDYQFKPPLTAWDECGPDGHWRNRGANQPFFAVFNTTVTHESKMWPREGEELKTNPDEVVLPPYLPDTPLIRKAMCRHYDNLSLADDYVGALLQQLEEDGLFENTVVMLWSDHGEGLPRAKRWTYDAGIRVPLIVRWPGQIQPGTVNERLVSLVDLAPTVLELAELQIPAHLQGRSFLREEERKFIYATRDRYDESYDMVRAVRDKQYKYIRNYFPNQSYQLWIPYLNQHPIQRELWQLYEEGKLQGLAAQFFGSGRPVEELYECEADPYEQYNLACNPDYTKVLDTMREALEQWRMKYDRLGEVPETEMIAQMWPSGKQPQTAKPRFVIINRGICSSELLEAGKVARPAFVQLHCSTQGASIAFKLDDNTDAPWSLYTGEIRITEGAAKLRARAIRIGYLESVETVLEFIG